MEASSSASRGPIGLVAVPNKQQCEQELTQSRIPLGIFGSAKEIEKAFTEYNQNPTQARQLIAFKLMQGAVRELLPLKDNTDQCKKAIDALPQRDSVFRVLFPEGIPQDLKEEFLLSLLVNELLEEANEPVDSRLRILAWQLSINKRALQHRYHEEKFFRKARLKGASTEEIRGAAAQCGLTYEQLRQKYARDRACQESAKTKIAQIQREHDRKAARLEETIRRDRLVKIGAAERRLKDLEDQQTKAIEEESRLYTKINKSPKPSNADTLEGERARLEREIQERERDIGIARQAFDESANYYTFFADITRAWEDVYALEDQMDEAAQAFVDENIPPFSLVERDYKYVYREGEPIKGPELREMKDLFTLMIRALEKKRYSYFEGLVRELLYSTEDDFDPKEELPGILGLAGKKLDRFLEEDLQTLSEERIREICANLEGAKARVKQTPPTS